MKDFKIYLQHDVQ